MGTRRENGRRARPCASDRRCPVRVTFCVAEEFLQEVRKDQDRVLRDIVRITCRYRA